MFYIVLEPLADVAGDLDLLFIDGREVRLDELGDLPEELLFIYLIHLVSMLDLIELDHEVVV